MMATTASTSTPRTEYRKSSSNGYLLAGVGLLFALAAVALVVGLASNALVDGWSVIALLLAAASAFTFAGLYMLQPNEAAILMLFGAYAGTDRSEGLRWANPLLRKRRLSLRSRNLNSPTLKVNDKRGNPVEIGAAIVWKVRDTAQALFEVDDYKLYVQVQAEAALRHLASQYAYDDGEDLPAGAITLRSGLDEVGLALKNELQQRFVAAGVEVEDAKLTHLAYAQEIAQVMLRRQQAEAIISARQRIVHGAVSMVETALKGLSEREIVVLDDERKAAMVSNLLVVLCSDSQVQPVVNAGTLYA